ncbi:acylphosphatase [Salinicoccus roseus]|uniref:acylphosphatase n=1 Tax=Salinicoccus roseus TaxID=45670 RepID=UPI0023010ECC|nr:acylphosphatase [Salinicoccus roseus]
MKKIVKDVIFLNNEEWLDHLKDSIPVTISGDKLSIYAIALEAWRRGLKVSFYEFKSKYREKIIINYTVSDGAREVKFTYSTGSDVTGKAKGISSSKTRTKKYLENEGVPIPKGQKFINKSNQQIIEYAEEHLDFPIVLKPASGKMGKGVIANIRNKEELKDALVYVRERLGFNEVILEEFIPGEEYRIYVLNGEVIAGLNRLPANVIGDGVNSLRKLIKIKNAERQQIPSVRGRPIKIDSEVKRNIKDYDYNLDSIPQKGERILLRKNSNLSTGGDPVDATDILDVKVKEVAVKAAKSVPDLVECGVDLIVDERDGTGKVIELNTSVGLGGHLFPLEGKSRDIPSALMDYYFPGTERITTDLYFDFTKMTEMLKVGNVHEIIMPVLPQEKIIKKSFIIKGKLEKVGFINFVHKKARYFRLNGFVEMRSDKSVLIVVAGTENNISEFQKMLTIEPPIKARIDEIKKGEWDSILEVGFKVIRSAESGKVTSEQKKIVSNVDNGYLQEFKKTNTDLEKAKAKLEKTNIDLNRTNTDLEKTIIGLNRTNVDLDKTNRDLSKINAELEKEIARLKRENEDFQRSKSWKVTRPLRLLSKRMAERKN